MSGFIIYIHRETLLGW